MVSGVRTTLLVMTVKKNADSTPNSDIASLPGASRDVQEGVAPLTPAEQLVQLNNYFEDNYEDIYRSVTTDEGAEFTAAGRSVPAELRDATERAWSRLPDLLTHSSQLVLRQSNLIRLYNLH